MKKMIFALAVLLASTSSFAAVIADGMYPTMSCRVPGMADGGYSVIVSVGGIAHLTNAKLVQDTIRGGVLVGNYTVMLSKTPAQDLVYADMSSRGQEFQLIIHGTPKIGAPAPAILRSNSKAGRFVEKLACMPMLMSR
ncbi:MAG: hypothetical protein ACJ763_19305 [Bdellovibrionia bacterium]